MEEEKVVTKPADARIVRAVRKLKSNVSNINNNTNDNIKNTQQTISEKNSLVYPNALCSDKNLVKNKENLKSALINTQVDIRENQKEIISKMPIKRDQSKKSTNKILLDGSIKQGVPSSSSSNKNVLKFDYETLKKYKKKQNTDFRKKLLSTESISKYKDEFVTLIKNDKNIKALLSKLNLVQDDNYKQYIENNFFNKPYFLVVLEMIMFEGVEQANTLKVFRNKNVLPLKIIKENIFRDEINKELNKKMYQIEYVNKTKAFEYNLNNFINTLQKTEIDIK